MNAAPARVDPPATPASRGAGSLPRATARLQLRPEFTLNDAAGVVGYYAALGVSHLYLSPVFGARPGSTHGYDVTDCTRVREELGGEAALAALASSAQAAGLGLILDIVPNHMAADATHNVWWRDVLAHGAESAFAAFFDIDWKPADRGLHGKVLMPILQHPYWESLAQGDVKLLPASADGAGCLRYLGHSLPLAPGSVDVRAAADPAWFDAAHASGREHLHALLELQYYRLAWWRTAAAALNWRRFFEISDLVGLRQEHAPVFDATHALVLRLLREGFIDGVRVDHVDGLSDPAAYCRRLREQLSVHAAQRPKAKPLSHPWLIVEKILAPGEVLPPDWQVDGTTGYDFMDQVAAVLHDPAGEEPLNGLWRRTARDRQDYAHVLAAARRRILTHHLIAEYEAMRARLLACASSSPATRDLTGAALGRALSAFLEAVPVYRSYLDGRPGERDAGTAAAEAAMLSKAACAARAMLAPDETAALDFILCCLRTPQGDGGAAAQIRKRLQQLMPALAAKAGEDTAYYRYGRLLSRNEVGSYPATLAIWPARFHADMAVRQHAVPRAMLATATHDHKRGEDARMRLAVLSELAPEWADAVGEWERECEPLRAALPREPDPADRLMLYQALVGAWPMQPDTLARDGELGAFLHRVGEWQRKAIREAKLHGNWTWPDLCYESACDAFLHGLAVNWPASGVLGGIGHFVQRVASAGALNSLAQTVVQLTAPGVPDRYQGCEDWDLSLVDPDNRRMPDFPRLQAQLGCTAGWAHWFSQWRDGRIKQQLIRHVLAARREHPTVFAEGAYSPLAAEGPLARQVLAFARTTSDCHVVTMATRLSARLVDPDLPWIPPACWTQTTLDVCVPQRSQWMDVLTGHRVATANGTLPLGKVLSLLPVALLMRQS